LHIAEKLLSGRGVLEDLKGFDVVEVVFSSVSKSRREQKGATELVHFEQLVRSELYFRTSPNYLSTMYCHIQYRVDSFQAKPTLTNRNSRVSRVKELSFGVCHKEAKRILGFRARCLVGRLARAKYGHKRDLPNFQSEY